MYTDPFNLDQTAFAKTIQTLFTDPLDDDAPDELDHPLLTDPAVAALTQHFRDFAEKLYRFRKTDEDIFDDAYFQFNEGLVLRPEVLARLALDFFRQYPGLLSSQQ